MKRLVAAAVFAAFAATATGCMTPPSPAPQTSASPQAGAAERAWSKAQAVVRATDADLSKGGIRSIGTHVAELEDALSKASQAFSGAGASGNPGYVLVDGQAETVAALLLSSTKGEGPTVAVQNPYPLVSFFLGTYYNEIRRYEDALRVLDAGLALPTPVPGADTGQTLPHMLSERGIALAALKRWPESLASYDRALAIRGLNEGERALLLRGRGFALIELGRLDDAERAYRDSLMAEPNNPRALQELSYIARLRAGGPAAPAGIFTRMAPQSP